MMRWIALLATLLASCATNGGPSLDPGTRRTALALELSSSDADVEGSGILDVDTFTLAGDIGWLVARQTEVGAAAAVAGSETSDGVDSLETTEIFLGPYARYYFASQGGAIPFVDARVGYSGLEVEVNGASVDGDGVLWALGVGVLAPLSNSVGIETTISYSVDSYEIDGVDVEIDGVSVLVGLSAFF